MCDLFVWLNSDVAARRGGILHIAPRFPVSIRLISLIKQNLVTEIVSQVKGSFWSPEEKTLLCLSEITVSYNI